MKVKNYFKGNVSVEIHHIHKLESSIFQGMYFPQADLWIQNPNRVQLEVNSKMYFQMYMEIQRN